MHDFGLSEEAIFPFQAWREHANRTERPDSGSGIESRTFLLLGNSAYSLSNYLKYYGH